MSNQLQYFCRILPILYFIDQRKLVFSRKLAMHNINFLLSLSRLVQNRFYAIGSVYGITTISASVGQIIMPVWLSLQRLKVLLCLYRLVYFLLLYWVLSMSARSVFIVVYFFVFLCSYCCLFWRIKSISQAFIEYCNMKCWIKHHSKIIQHKTRL